MHTNTFIKTLLNKIYLQKWVTYNFLDKVLRAYILIFRVKHEKGYAICGLSWHPTCAQIAYTDAEGNLGLLENVCDPNGKKLNNNKRREVPTICAFQFISDQLLRCVESLATPWTAVGQASLSITSSQSSLKLMSIESVMPSNRHILCCPLLLPSVFPSIKVFTNELAFHIR